MVHLATKKFDGRKLTLLCLLAATAVLQACGGSSESEFEQIVRQSNCVTADQVYSDYQNNEVAAQQKYQGNVTRICGIVDEIELNLFNEPLISLRASLLGSVSIGDIDTASAANISKGSVAVFECNKINELLGIPVLMECRIVPTQNMQNEAAPAAEVSTPNGGMPNNAMAYAGKYPSERIDGYGIFDAPDLQAAVKGMPEGNQIWAQITSESRVLDVESPNRVSDGGQSIVIQKCEAHNCGGPSSRQLVLKYFTPSNGRTGQAAVCLKNGASRQIYLSWGIGDLGAEMPGNECKEESFDYVD